MLVKRAGIKKNRFHSRTYRRLSTEEKTILHLTEAVSLTTEDGIIDSEVVTELYDFLVFLIKMDRFAGTTGTGVEQ